MRRTILLAVCAAIAAAGMASHADAYEPRPDYETAIGIVWDDGIPYALTFTAEGELGDAAWNITDGMARIEPHQYTVDDAEWGNNMGYTHMLLDGERHGVVATATVYGPPGAAAVAGPPVLVHVGDAEAYTEENTHESGSFIKVQGNNLRLVVTQTWWAGHDLNQTTTTHHFHSVDGPPVEAPRPSTYGNPFHYAGEDTTKLVVSIDGQNHAVVNTVDGPPVLVDVMGAAALGLGDISSTVPTDYMKWNVPPSLQTVPIDESAEIRIMEVGHGRTWAAINYTGHVRIYEITNPHDIVPANLHHDDDPERLWAEYDRILGSGFGMMHASLEHPGRAAYDIPERLNIGMEAPRLDPAGAWVVAVSPDGTVSAHETDPNTAVSITYEGGRTYASERDAGWHDAVHDIRSYDITDPASPVLVNRTVPYDMEWGELGRAATAHADGAAWALIPVRDEHVAGPAIESKTRTVNVLYEGPMGIPITISTGPVMEVTGLSARHGVNDQVHAGATVRNIHHEPITVRIDRLVVGQFDNTRLVLDKSHQYSQFESPGYSAVWLSGPTSGAGYFGPAISKPAQTIEQDRGLYRTEYYPGVRIVYSAEQWGRVFAYVQATDSITLAPGESKRISATVYTACASDPTILPSIDACGLGGASLSLGVVGSSDGMFRDIWQNRFYHNVELTLVVDGHPEWTVTVGQGWYAR